MKGLSLVLLALSFSAGAVTSPDLKGSFDLSEITTNFAKTIGIKGALPVSINAEVTEASLKFLGYRKATYCIEYNDDGIPQHPETRSCAKEETSFTPEVAMDVKNFALNVNVAEVKMNEKLSNTIKLCDECIENMETVKVISEVMPTEIPRIFITKNCKAAVYPRFERLNVKAKALKGFSMEAIFDLDIAVSFAKAPYIEVNSKDAVAVDLTAVKVSPLRNGLASLGKYNTRIFKYYGTVRFEK